MKLLQFILLNSILFTASCNSENQRNNINAINDTLTQNEDTLIKQSNADFKSDYVHSF